MRLHIEGGRTREAVIVGDRDRDGQDTGEQDTERADNALFRAMI